MVAANRSNPVLPPLPSQLWSTGSLPPITYEWLLIMMALLVIIHILMKMLLSNYFKINTVRNDPHVATLEYSPFYHLSIIILVLSEMDWNVFDVSIWLMLYVGVSLVRSGLFSIKFER